MQHHTHPNPAMEKALNHIADVFRDERKQNESILLSGHRIKQLVEDGRYSYMEACAALNTTAAQVREANAWLCEDDERLNKEYETDIHHRSPGDHVMSLWFWQQEQNKIVKLGVA